MEDTDYDDYEFNHNFIDEKLREIKNLLNNNYICLI